MSTTLQADENGTVHVPSRLLPDGGPGALYHLERREDAVILSPEKWTPAGKPFWQSASPKEQAEAFLKWARKPRRAAGLSKSATSRDSIYD